MADDLTKLVFEIEQRGAVEVEKRFSNIEQALGQTLKQYRDMSKEADGSAKSVIKSTEAVRATLSNLEKGIVEAGNAYGGMFSGGKIKRQEQNLRKLQKEWDKLSKQRTAGTAEEKKAAEERMKALKRTIDFEAAQTTKIFQQHKKEFDKIVAEEKRTIGDLTKEGFGGLGGALQDLRGGDIRGAGGRLSSGIGELGQQAGKRGVDMEMAGGNAKMAKMLKTFAKVAGPLAVAAGALTAVVAAFVALDEKVTEINKSMLQNVSLVELAGGSYEDMDKRIASAENAMEEFQQTAASNMDLRMLGLDEGEMGSILSALNEQGMLLGDLRDQGVDYASALEVAQVAALNLGVDASETAGLIGTLADVTSQSFDEAAASLTQIISFAQDAGVSTKKFFSVVQNVVGEMGLYNYRIEETAALFSHLSNIMDAQSAEEMTNQLASSVKNMTALERTSLVVVNGIGKVAAMADKTQERLAKSMDPSKLQAAFREIGKEGLFNPKDIESSMEKLSTSQRNMLQSAISDIDQATGEELRKYRNILEANRGDVMELQGILGDFALGDQIQLQIGDIEKKLGMPLENINSVLAESQGVSESQLRMLKAVKSDLSGDLQRLQAVAGNDEAFDKLAKEMGYNVKQSEVMSGKMDAFDLMSTMTEKKQGALLEEQKDQKTLAEKSADMQRSMLDTVKYKLLDLVSGIYRAILDIHSAIMKWRGKSDAGADLRREAISRDFALRKEERRVSQMQPGEAKEKAQAELRNKRANLEAYQQRIDKTSNVDAVTINGKRIGRKQAVELMGRHNVSSVEELQQVLSQTSLRDRVKSDLEARGATPVSLDGRNAVLTPAQIAAQRKKGRSVMPVKGEIGANMLNNYIDAKTSRIRKAGGKDLEESLAEGAVTQEKLRKLQEEQVSLFKEKGILLDPKAANEIAKAIVEEQLKAEIQRSVAGAGFSGEQGAQLTSMLMSGNRAGIAEFKKGLGTGQRSGLDALTKRFIPKPAKDAKILTGGIPMLDLQAGDIIVDQEALAGALAGGRGDFVPELMRRAGGGGGGGSLNANFYINGGNPQEVRSVVMKVLQDWERKRSIT